MYSCRLAYLNIWLRIDRSICKVLRDERIFASLTTAGLALKLPGDDRAALMTRGGKPLRYFTTGPVKKDYVILPDALVHDAPALAPWIEKSTRFA